MEYIPGSYNDINIIESAGNPNYMNIANSTLYEFYMRYLLQKVFSIFEWDLPETWAKEYLQYCLAVYGYVAVMEWPELGVIYQHGRVFGHDMYYQPSHILVTNPFIENRFTGNYAVITEYRNNRIELPEASGPVIGECMLLKLTPNYCGILDIINTFAIEMTLVHMGIDVNILQSKDPKIFAAGNDAAAKAFKKAMDDVLSGETQVIMHKSLFNDDGTPNFYEFNKDLHSSYIGDKLLDALRTIENRFDSMIGISNTNISKRANMTVAEVTANEDEVNALPVVWSDCLKRSIDLIKRRYNIELDIKLKGVNNEKGNIDDIGPVSVGSDDI